MDDSIETNVSTFAAEMREIAFILRNIDKRSLSVCWRRDKSDEHKADVAIGLLSMS
jgi:DNA mismatch repair protein MSH4